MQLYRNGSEFISFGDYSDLLAGIQFKIFLALNVGMEELSRGARALLKVKERLEIAND